MITAALLVHFFLCGPTEMFCEEGRMTHHSCAAAEDWLRAGLKPDQVLLVAGCMAADQDNLNANSSSEEAAVPMIAARISTSGVE